MTATGNRVRTLPAHVELEHWYRWLLRAYPVGYRRVHGDEILATLMDCAEAGRRRPARADVVDVVRGAVRQWFRLPVGLPALVAAVLSALVLGAMGAAAGSWLAWETAAELPSDNVALRTTETSAGEPLRAPEIHRHDGWRADWRVVQVADPDPRGLSNWTLEAAQARLSADGWTIGRGEERPVEHIGDDAGAAAETVHAFLATRDGHVLLVNAYTAPVPGGSRTTISTYVHPDTPRWEPPAILLGWLLGAVAGWLLTGWAGYRLRHRAMPLRAIAVTLGGTALWAAAEPVGGLYRAVGELAFADPGVEPAYPSYGSVLGNPEQAGVTLALAVTILTLAATGRRRSAPPTTAAAA